MDELNYQEVAEKIKARFPAGTVQHRGDNRRAYIPNQVYTDHVEKITGSRWDREIRDVEINVAAGFVKVIARVTIGGHYRDGVGFAEVDKDENGKPKRLSNKVDLAVNEAVREALDTWQIGWRDLAQYYREDWGANPALRDLNPPHPPDSLPAPQTNAKVDRYCIFTNCGVNLSQQEWDLLGKVPNLNREKMVYCFEHLPAHLKRKLPKELLSKQGHKLDE